MIIWAKLSDIFGRKQIFITTIFIFTAFSGGCGGSQALDQLWKLSSTIFLRPYWHTSSVICRTFQGIGAAGVYSMAALVTYEMVPKAKLPWYGGLNSAAVALSTLIGPLCGGLINNYTTWRWVFLLKYVEVTLEWCRFDKFCSLPLGIIVIAALFLGLPSNFPKQLRINQTRQTENKRMYHVKLAKLDILGAILLLGGSLLLATALLEVPTRFSWSSAATIVCLVFASLSWIGFFVWEWYISRYDCRREPVFPWHFLNDRTWIGMLMYDLITSWLSLTLLTYGFGKPAPHFLWASLSMWWLCFCLKDSRSSLAQALWTQGFGCSHIHSLLRWVLFSRIWSALHAELQSSISYCVEHSSKH